MTGLHSNPLYKIHIAYLDLDLAKIYVLFMRIQSYILVCRTTTSTEPTELEYASNLIDTLERRNGLALVFVQSGVNNTTVLQLNIRGVDISLE